MLFGCAISDMIAWHRRRDCGIGAEGRWRAAPAVEEGHAAVMRPCPARCAMSSASGRMAAMEGESEAARIPARRWTTIALGALAGLLNGLVALGGGILVTPYLIGYRGLVPSVAVGTSLAVVVLLSAIAFAAHAAQGNLAIGWGRMAVCGLGGLLGSAIGARILAKLTPRWLLKAFAVFLMLVSARLIAQGAGVSFDTSMTALPVPSAAFFAIGLVTGVISAMFGVGGGALALLSLALIFGMPVKEGLPVALALNVTNALAGVVYQARRGNIQLGEVQSLIPAAIIGVLAGTWLAQLIPPQFLRIVFGAVLLLLAGRLLFSQR
ncbi:MAG: sulfite exporter TauE/SafE family protein [Hyphomicrobiaceae bacterium]